MKTVYPQFVSVTSLSHRVKSANVRTGPNEGNASESDRPSGTSRHQAIFSIDYETWQKLIVAYDITESMIPHREEENIGVPNAHGWYD